MTAQVHPDVRLLAEELTKAFGLATAGVDYITTDISAAPNQTGGCLIEINAFPGLDATVAAGWASEDIAAMVLGDLPARISINLIVLSEQAIQDAMTELQSSAVDPSSGWVGGGSGRLGEMRISVSLHEPWVMGHGACCASTPFA